MSSDTEADEVTDAELLKEIEQEKKKLEEQLGNHTNSVNATFTNSTLNASSVGFDSLRHENSTAHLAPWQDSIITTGSDVSMVLMSLLVILFIIQAIRKLFQYYRMQKKLANVPSVLVDATPRSAEDMLPFSSNIKPHEYPVLNTKFIERESYEKAKESGQSLPTLKKLLLDRALNCIKRVHAIQREGPGIKKNYGQDLTPPDVWDDFQMAQANVNDEMERIARENQELNFSWGQHGTNVFSCAREALEMQVEQIQRANYLNHIRQNAGGAPSAKNFGSGFNKGFLQNDGGRKLSNRERKELRQKKKEEKKNQQMESALSQPRRRKGKHRFGKS